MQIFAKIRSGIALAAVCCVSLPPGCDGGTNNDRALTEKLTERIPSVMQAAMRRHDVPGAAIAIAYKGAILFNQGYGYADRDAKTTVTSDTAFRVAGVSQAITAAAILKLYENELPAALDYPVFGAKGILPDSAFPEFAVRRDARMANIRLRDLLQHTSGWGIDGYDPQFDLVNIARAMGVTPPASARTVVAYMLQNRSLGVNPGTRVQYSNFGYNILGRVIEYKSGRSYAQAVRELVLTPAGASGMFIAGSTLAERKPSESLYYDNPLAATVRAQDGSGDTGPEAYYGYHFPSMDAHGGWAGTPADLVRFALAATETESAAALFKEKTVTLMSKADARFADARYGLGWEVWNRDGVAMLEHGGALETGSYAFVQTRADGWTWAIAFNRLPVTGSDNLTLDAMNRDLGQIQSDLAAAIVATIEKE
ncbi:serine hydrolase domain-containing protein [Noviherbaspirillum pedocola]|uniref:Beta-lactamase family protein n=1 Tax=Noviherbaspirillum pedocola TaxID=2801341 RepID=A0A934W4A6_9BURK|nr:serine hydrolase domain-containing protein [Noviherbaspirillum pedocola]MBK4733677.1 beta-lactamase family protein [Noviherbaspirillum pedocola]